MILKLYQRINILVIILLNILHNFIKVYLFLRILQVILLKEKLGFDEAFNYREESNLKSTLKRLFLYMHVPC